ncbi:hypothetical protein [Lactobacillus sp.]
MLEAAKIFNEFIIIVHGFNFNKTLRKCQTFLRDFWQGKRTPPIGGVLQ